MKIIRIKDNIYCRIGHPKQKDDFECMRFRLGNLLKQRQTFFEIPLTLFQGRPPPSNYSEFFF